MSPQDLIVTLQSLAIAMVVAITWRQGREIGRLRDEVDHLHGGPDGPSEDAVLDRREPAGRRSG